MKNYDYEEKSVEDNTSGELITKDTVCKLINGEISIPDKDLNNIDDFFIDDHYEGEFFRRYSAEVGGVNWMVDYNYHYKDIFLGLGYTSYDDYTPENDDSGEDSLITFVPSPVIPTVFALAVAKDLIENDLKIERLDIECIYDNGILKINL